MNIKNTFKLKQTSFLLLAILLLPSILFASPGPQIHINETQSLGFVNYETKKLYPDPTGQRVVYTSDEHEPFVDRLISVGLTGGAGIVYDQYPNSIATDFDIINPDFKNVEVSPDGQFIVFIMNPNRSQPNARLELLSVPINGGPIVHLSSKLAMPVYLKMQGFKISPNSKKVVFQVTSNEFNVPGFGPQVYVDCYSVDITGGAVTNVYSATALYNATNRTFFPQFEVSSNSAQVIFSKLNSGGGVSLYATPITSGTITEISAPSSEGKTVIDMKVSSSPGKNMVLFRHDSKQVGQYLLYHVLLSNFERTLVNNDVAPLGTETTSKYDYSPDLQKIIYISDEDDLGTLKVKYRNLSNWSGGAMHKEVGEDTRFFYTTKDPNILILFGLRRIYSYNLSQDKANLIKSLPSQAVGEFIFISNNRVVLSYKPTVASVSFVLESFLYNGDDIETSDAIFNEPFGLSYNINSDFFYLIDNEIGEPPISTRVFKNDFSESFDPFLVQNVNTDRFEVEFSKDGQRLLIVSNKDDGSTYKLFSQKLDGTTFVDIVPPVINITGLSTMHHELATYYTDQGATAHDDEDGNITENIITTGDVDIYNIGTNEITYSVTDNAGNPSTATRIVEVVEFCNGEPYLDGYITDSDIDGYNDCLDLCPFDEMKITPGVCGCGELDVDVDGDGQIDCGAITTFKSSINSIQDLVKGIKGKKAKNKKEVRTSLKALLKLKNTNILNSKKKRTRKILNKLNQLVRSTLFYSSKKNFDKTLFRKSKSQTNRHIKKVIKLIRY